MGTVKDSTRLRKALNRKQAKMENTERLTEAKSITSKNSGQKFQRFGYIFAVLMLVMNFVVLFHFYWWSPVTILHDQQKIAANHEISLSQVTRQGNAC